LIVGIDKGIKEWIEGRITKLTPIGGGKYIIGIDMAEGEDQTVYNTISKPQHYADKEIEVIDYIRDTLTQDQYEGYCIGNILKYVSRYRLKGGVEDLKKANYYLEDVIDRLESD